MARSSRSTRAPRSLTIHRDVRITVREAPFRTFDSLKRLDVQRLKRAARARFEVGWFESGCNQRIVHAIVEKGRVTRLELERCPDPVRLSAEWRPVVQAARKALAGHRKSALRRSVGVDSFLSNAAGFTIDTYGCFTICLFGICLTCCWDDRNPQTNECHLH
jgi:hypothetical protein